MKPAVFLKVILLFVWLFCPDVTFCEVKQLDSSEFDAFIAGNQLVVILFKASEDCPSCVKAREYFDRVQQPDLIQKEIHKRYVIDEDLAEKFMATDYPAIVFFRYGHPVVYNEKLQSSDDLMAFVEWLEVASELVVRVLHDSTFEHLTQAATGATTGDWFVLFYIPETPEFTRIFPAFDSAAVSLKHRMNFAMVDADTNKNIVKRFSVKKTPHIILFKQGKMYRYEPEKFDTASFTAFIEGWYRNVQAVVVPKEPTAFDILTENIALFIKERMEDPSRRWMVLTAGAVSAFGLVGILYCVFCRKEKDLRSKSD